MVFIAGDGHVLEAFRVPHHEQDIRVVDFAFGTERIHKPLHRQTRSVHVYSM